MTMDAALLSREHSNSLEVEQIFFMVSKKRKVDIKWREIPGDGRLTRANASQLSQYT